MYFLPANCCSAEGLADPTKPKLDLALSSIAEPKLEIVMSVKPLLAILLVAAAAAGHAATIDLICGNKLITINEDDRSITLNGIVYKGRDIENDRVHSQSVHEFNSSRIVFEDRWAANNQGRRFNHEIFDLNRHSGRFTTTVLVESGEVISPTKKLSEMCEKRGTPRF
jgi:hypothetical protein